MSVSASELNPKPIRVSPVIKFTRWTLLTLGILYGAYFHNKFSKIEQAIREQKERDRPALEAKLAEERRLILEAEKQMVRDLEEGRV